MSRRLTDEDIARVAAEAGIEPADLAPLAGGAEAFRLFLMGGDLRTLAEQPLRAWLDGMLANYFGQNEIYAELPPQGWKNVYKHLERKVRAVRALLDANPWLVGDMIDWECSRLESRPGADDDRVERIVNAAGRRVQRDVRALDLLEKRARAGRGGRQRHEGDVKPIGKPALDDLTTTIFIFWHYVLKRKVLNEDGGVAIGSADAPAPLPALRARSTAWRRARSGVSASRPCDGG